jgi:hypothetical protein
MSENKNGPISDIKEYAGIVIGYSSLFAALLWVSGRSYALGYFSSMNIPIYMVNFQYLEYAEQAWITIPIITALFIIGGTILTSIFKRIIKYIDEHILPYVKRICISLKKKITRK